MALLRKEILVTRWAWTYKRCHKVRTGPEHEVNYYAHTAVKSDGTPDSDKAKWQLLSMRSRIAPL